MRASVALLFAFAVPVAAQTTTVRGVAYDSLANTPLANAYVTIPRLHRATTSDSLGRFSFDSVAPGSYVVAMQHDALEALGLPSVMRPLVVSAGGSTIVLATPSLTGLWRSMCGSAAPADTALVYGTVVTPDHHPAEAATVSVSWLDLVAENHKAVSQHRKQGRVESDGNGRYVLCGVPMNTGITLRASRDSTDSGVLELLPLEHGVLRRDIQLNRRGATTVGVVTGTVALEGGREPSGVRVSIDGLPDVRVRGDGRFTIPNVPFGTRQIEATFVGMSPALATVDVSPNDTARVQLTLKRIVELPGMTVTGSAVRMQLAREFEQRRAEGVGQFRDSSQIAKYSALESVFQDMNSVFVKGGVGRRAIYIGFCTTPAALIVDGTFTLPGDFAWRDHRDIAAVEVYTRTNLAPQEFMAKLPPRAAGCGLVVMWTKNKFP